MSKNEKDGLDQYVAERFGRLILPKSKNVGLKGLSNKTTTTTMVTSWVMRCSLGLLWRAPELLRDPNSLPRGSQKGDVYSFAFILYEIHARCGPWGDTAMTPKGICTYGRLYKPVLLLTPSTPAVPN